MSDLTIENWTEQAADVLTKNHVEYNGPLVHTDCNDDEFTVTHPPSATTATNGDLPTTFVKLLRKLHDRTIDLLATRDGMCCIDVDALDGVLKDGARVTRAAIDEGYIEARQERVLCKNIPGRHWRAVSDDITEINGGKTHMELAGAVEALLRMQGFKMFAYEDDARYAPNTGVKADIAVPHAGIYVEVAGHEGGGLSDDPDKIARCLDVGRGKHWKCNDPVVAESQHIYDDPPGNPVTELIYVPWFDDAPRLKDTVDVTLPVYVFSRTDKELRQRRR